MNRSTLQYLSIVGLLALCWCLSIDCLDAQTLVGTDIGVVGKAGTNSYNASTGTYTLSGSGADIWNTSDAFRFVYESIPGDGELTARVVNVQAVNSWSKAGVMVRQDTTASAVQGITVVTPSEGVALAIRE